LNELLTSLVLHHVVLGLHEFQQLAGWINWALNVFPLLKLGLSNIYVKMSGKTESHAMIYGSIFKVTDCSIDQAN
jgi:hypothetical protein